MIDLTLFVTINNAKNAERRWIKQAKDLTEKKFSVRNVLYRKKTEAKKRAKQMTSAYYNLTENCHGEVCCMQEKTIGRVRVVCRKETK